ncbi:MAG: DUF559 domain-containing protein [Solirubrobacteraceae bacterium]
MAKVVSPHVVSALLAARGEPDGLAAWVAEQQLGLVTAAQLSAAGLTRKWIRRQLSAGLLHRRHQGVYLLGHPILLPGAREFAGVLACGARAYVSHGSSAGLWVLAKPEPEPGSSPGCGPDRPVHITVVGRSCKPRKGLCIHNVIRLHPADRASCHGIPLTAPARTIIDCAAEVTPDEVEDLLAEAHARGLADEQAIDRAIARWPHRAGVAAVRTARRHEGGPKWTRSKAERIMRSLLREARLPEPRMNEFVVGWPADFLWPAHRLIIEVDGYLAHGHRRAYERDRRRDQAHIAAGYTVIRITYRQLQGEPLSIVAMIAAALARRVPDDAGDSRAAL